MKKKATGRRTPGTTLQHLVELAQEVIRLEDQGRAQLPKGLVNRARRAVADLK